jgi:bacteriocin-like protein
MNSELTINNELTIDELDAVSGGAKSIYEAFAEGIIKGFREAGGTVTCFPTGTGDQVCGFKA